MAVIKLNYTKNRQKAKASLRYMVHRLGREAQRLTRTLFAESGEVDKRAGYELMDKAFRGSVFFRMIFTPDPAREDSASARTLCRRGGSPRAGRSLARKSKVTASP